MTEQQGPGQKAGQAAGEPAGLTHVLLAVDKSGSMWRVEDDVRGGFNAFLDDLAGRDHADRFRVTVVLFSTDLAVLCTDARIADVPRLDADNYQARGNTALYDAVGTLIREFEHSTTLGDDERVLLVVQTDGRNNSSVEFGASDILSMIGQRERTGRWTSVYLGAGPAAWHGGTSMGMQSVNTTADSSGTQRSYAGLSAAAVAYAAGGSAAETFGVLDEAAGGERK